MAKNAPLRQLHVASGGRRNRFKQWRKTKVMDGLRTESETRKGRKRLNVIHHQAKLRHKQDRLMSK